MKLKTLLKFFFVTSFVVSAGGCKKFVDIPPSPTEIMSYRVFENDGTATRAVTGIYTEMMNNNSFSSSAATFYAGLSSDELYYYSTDFRQEFLKNEITQTNHGLLSSVFWVPAYKFIYAANACIEGINNSATVSAPAKKTLTGEAKFIRAYCYFYLVNLFGDVPLVTATNYEVSSVMARTSKATVYQQIIADLTEAQDLLGTAYTSAERVRPNKWAAAALLARMYLYMQDWSKAEALASSVIASGSYSLVSNLNNVFLKTSSETILQLQPGSTNINTWEGNIIVPASSGATPTYLIRDTLLKSFETGDQRKTNWIQSRVFSNQTLYYPYKYKVSSNLTVTEYYILLRLAEQYLIRAEARAQQNKVTEGLADLNIIRNRAGLGNSSANDKASLLSAIEHERQVELFAEWGHRWLDLKRTGRANAVLGGLKPLTWQPTDVLWPIPSQQINLNSSLSQNPGY